ncbi:MAG: hypothetical protein QM534_00060 [Sediminibacterium sp.]|nr:hypothetical protein [Sediminibacterium sp.]
MSFPMSDCPEIKLLKGFCTVVFGNTGSHIREAFGEPDETEHLEDDILETSCDVWHYWDRGFSLFFDNFKNNVFTSVEVDHPDTLLFNQKIFMLKENEVVTLLKTNGFALSESEQHEWGEKRLSFDEAGLDCYFEKGKLVSVNFGILPDDTNFYYHPN